MKIDVWYDRHTRSWVIEKKDNDGNQICDAIYCGNKIEKDFIVKELENDNRSAEKSKE